MESNLVVLIYPKLVASKGGSREGKPLLPLPVLSIGTVLKKNGYEVAIIDGRIEDGYDAALQSLRGKPLCIGISCMLSYQVQDSIDVAKLCRKQFPGTPILWGGWFPTILPDAVIASPFADIVVRGLGEKVILEIADSLKAGTSLVSIAGISFKSGNAVVTNPDRQLGDLNSFPPVDYDLVDTRRYSIANKSINYISSRGCPHRCGFCCIRRVFNFRWIPLDARRVIDDLKNITSHFAIDSVTFVDDNFFANKARVLEIVQGLLDNKISVTWNADMRVDFASKLDDDFLKLIKKAGCNRIFFGAESGSQRLLDRISKGIKKEQILEAAKKLAAHKIYSQFSFICGMPGETVDDFTETIRLMQQLRKISKYVFTLLCYYMPIPGSPLYITEEKEGKLPAFKSLEDWAGYIREDVTAPWRFENDDRIYLASTETRKRIRMMSFYNHICNSAHIHLGQYRSNPAVNMAYRFAGAVGNFRVASNFYAFPFEYWIYKRFMQRNAGIAR